MNNSLLKPNKNKIELNTHTLLMQIIYSYNIPLIYAHNQFWAHIKASNVLGCNLLRCGLTNLPLVLKADSEATVETWMAKISLAIACKVGYLLPFAFHQANMSKLGDLGKTGSPK